jgi:nitrogen fixation/metabolism regulation signal transduction histidine kinase
MPYSALYQLTNSRRTQYVQNENIGKLNYIAAYEPIRNGDGVIIGYLSIPYFTKQAELQKEIASLLVTLINVYILLFSLAIAIAYIISQRITQPLILIQQRLAKVKLGAKSEPIKWTKDDEIGGLVKEYNRMVVELVHSAEMLAQNERELAWREMAQQVAHEIKNPLTPMKLSVQHLQRAWKDRVTNIDDVIERISQTLIQQIDTLSGIATAFSNFAQMPKANSQLIELDAVLAATADLFKTSAGVEVLFLKPPTYNSTSSYQVFLDREQLSRVFNNLIKNAIQSIPPGMRGKVVLKIHQELGYYIISVEDNGAGIDDELKDKIFMPNFTTKSTGTGLGLAMVKKIVEYFGGSIWFDSKVDAGTTFYVKIPAYQEPASAEN